MKGWGLTDTGRRRQLNEDQIYVGNALFIVADGMGGHNAGEVASRIAVEGLVEEISWDESKILSKEEVQNLLQNGIDFVNSKIFKLSGTEDQYAEMGTTVVLCLVVGNVGYIVNIGDSRGYLIRNNDMIQITKDHSLVNELLERGTITVEEAKHHPQKNMITRAIGTDEIVEMDFFSVELESNDYILLCSDGLTGVLEEGQILQILNEHGYNEVGVQALVDEANGLGGPDNISIILLQYGDR